MGGFLSSQTDYERQEDEEETYPPIVKAKQDDVFAKLGPDGEPVDAELAPLLQPGEPWSGQLPQDVLQYILLLSAWEPNVHPRDVLCSWTRFSRWALVCKDTHAFVTGHDRREEAPGVPRILALSLAWMCKRKSMLRAIVIRLGITCTDAEAHIPWDVEPSHWIHQLRLSTIASRSALEISDAALGVSLKATARPLTDLEAHKNALHPCFGAEVNGFIEAKAGLDLKRPEDMQYWHGCSPEQRDFSWCRARTYFFDMRHTQWDVAQGTVTVVTTALPSTYSGTHAPTRLDPVPKIGSEQPEGPHGPGSTIRRMVMQDWQKMAARIYLFLRRPELIALPRFMTVLLELLAEWECACERGETENLGELGYASSSYANVAVYAIWRTKLLLGQGKHAVDSGRQRRLAFEQQYRLLCWVRDRVSAANAQRSHSPFQIYETYYWRDRSSCMAMSRFWFSKTGVKKASSWNVEETYPFPSEPIDRSTEYL